jgi:hypothetical protein
MTAIFPIQEIEARLEVRSPEVAEWVFPEANPQVFSLPLASALADLCAAAETSSNPIVIKRQGRDVFVAFRSDGDPAQIFNIRGTAEINGTPFGSGKGYGPLLEAYRREASGTLPALRAAGTRLWLSGHGIGGAFAIFSAVDLGQSVAAVYTYGAPRAGDRPLVRGLTCPVFRVVNNLDVMVTLPTAWAWRHVGQHKLLQADGSLNASPSLWNRLPSLSRQTVWLAQMLREGLWSGFPRAIFTLLQRVLSDHALSAYQEHLRALRD